MTLNKGIHRVDHILGVNDRRLLQRVNIIILVIVVFREVGEVQLFNVELLRWLSESRLGLEGRVIFRTFQSLLAKNLVSSDLAPGGSGICSFCIRDLVLCGVPRSYPILFLHFGFPLL